MSPAEMNLVSLNFDDSKQSILFVTNSDNSTTKVYQMVENFPGNDMHPFVNIGFESCVGCLDIIWERLWC